jgi:hypothetical protein
MLVKMFFSWFRRRMLLPLFFVVIPLIHIVSCFLTFQFKRLTRGFIELSGPSGGHCFWSPPDGNLYQKKAASRLFCVSAVFYSFILGHLEGCPYYDPNPDKPKSCTTSKYTGHTHKGPLPFRLFAHHLARWLVRIFYSLNPYAKEVEVVQQLIAEWRWSWDFNPRHLVRRMRDTKANARSKWGTAEKVAADPLVGQPGLEAYRRVVDYIASHVDEVSKYWELPGPSKSFVFLSWNLRGRSL